MRPAIIALLAVVALPLVSKPATAETYYPWCAWYDDWTSNCGFTTQQQCLATVSGAGGICKPNPYSAPANAERPRRKNQSRGIY